MNKIISFLIIIVFLWGAFPTVASGKIIPEEVKIKFTRNEFRNSTSTSEQKSIQKFLLKELGSKLAQYDVNIGYRADYGDYTDYSIALTEKNKEVDHRSLPDENYYSIRLTHADQQISKIQIGDSLDKTVQRSAVVTMTEETYSNPMKFPWKSGVNYYYAQKWHKSENSLTLSALDLGTTSAGDRHILAPADGQIGYIQYCNTAGFFNLHIGGYQYQFSHMDPDRMSPLVKTGQRVNTGDFLGEIISGPIPWENCGTSGQNIQSAHLHLAMKDGVNHLFENWKIKYGDDNFYDINNTSITRSESYVPELLSSNNLNLEICKSLSNIIIDRLTTDSDDTYTCTGQGSVVIKPTTAFLSGSNITISAT